MDGISDQVEFRFEISDDRHPDPKDVQARNFKVLADIEGHLEIAVGDSTVIEESGVLLMELGLDMLKWILNVRTERMGNFEYVSMDYAEGAILRFVEVTDNHWNICSPWMEHRPEVRVEASALFTAVERYLERLQTQLLERFSIQLSDW